MPAEVRAAWRGRYITQAEAELRVLAMLDQAEAALRAGRRSGHDPDSLDRSG